MLAVLGLRSVLMRLVAVIVAFAAVLVGGCTGGSNVKVNASTTARPAARTQAAGASSTQHVAGRVQQAEPGSRISWQGDTRFLLGANVPWLTWGCDFGCGGNGGVSDPNVQGKLAPVFAQARQAGMATLRWWMFEGTPWQITKDGNGTPTGIDPRVYTDIDAALALADQYDLSFDFVLFSAPTALPSGWLTDPNQRAALAAALAPLFAHYSGNPHILAWEIFNEPEADIWNKKIAQQPVQDTVKALVDDVHANSTTYVTVGSLMLDGLPMWTGMGLDFYEAHWYDYMNKGNYDAMLWSYDDIKARYNLDKPLVIGEFYAGPDSGPLDRLAHFYNTGYAGAWAWSLLPYATADKLAIDVSAMNQFNSGLADGSPAVDLGVAIPAYTAYVAPSFTMSVDSSTLQAQASGPASFTVSVTSQTATTALVDVEIYDANYKKVYQQYFDNESFDAGQTKSYTVTWNTPVAGTYTVMGGVFGAGWGKSYNWNANLAQLTISP